MPVVIVDAVILSQPIELIVATLAYSPDGVSPNIVYASTDDIALIMVPFFQLIPSILI